MASGHSDAVALDPRPGRSSSGASAIGWAIGGFLTVADGVWIWGAPQLGTWIAPASVAVVIVGIVGAAWSIVRSAGWQVQATLLAASSFASVVRVAAAIHGSPAYGSDEAAFDQYAASLLLHGVNPYTHSLAHSLSMFNVPDGARTYTTAGKLIVRLSYPALGFLPLVPVLAVGVTAQAAVWLSVAGWIATAGVAWRTLPSKASWVAVGFLSAAIPISYVASGLSDPVAMPMLVLAIAKWRYFGNRELPTWRRLVSPVALGLACAVKQTPWVVAPFVIVAVWCSTSENGRLRDGFRSTGAYAAVVGLSFLLPNIWFIYASPGAWWRGISTPLRANLMPAGQGIVSVILRATGGSPGLLNVGGVLVFCGLLLAVIGWWPRSQGLVVIAPSLALLFRSRSFSSYELFLVPAAIVGALSSRSLVAQGGLPWSPRLLRLCAAAPLGIGLTVAIESFSGPSSAISIEGVGVLGQLQLVDRVRVRIVNLSPSPIVPKFVVSGSGVLGSPWRTDITRVPAFGRRTGVLYAPDVASMPASSASFVVDMFVSGGVVVRVGAAQGADLRTVLTPSVVSHLRIGESVSMSARLQSAFGAAVHRSGVVIALAQVSYASSGIMLGEASINGAAEGKTPVLARTNADGVAFFRVKIVQRSGPLFLVAWVVGPNGGVEAPSQEVLVGA